MSLPLVISPSVANGAVGGRPFVRLDSVWKQFRRNDRHDSLRDLLPALAQTLFRRPSPNGESRGQFWGLRDVSFEVSAGQVLGIIGPNGAGKSTILKLITGIMRPTRGTVTVRGRVGALIEVAAGFHPDLTGRENVFLQGATMGMGRDEIARRFDEIVEFAGVGEFIDTPVKRYSSGMNARLGFAVAAHFDPDVLLVDEVLTVGDLAFQRKAMERIEQLVKRQIPVVLISHQLDRVLKLCDQAILLARGMVVARGSAAECITAYTEGQQFRELANDGPPAPIELIALDGAVAAPVSAGDEVRFLLRGVVHDAQGARGAKVGLRVRSLPGEEPLYATNHVGCGLELPASGPFELEIKLQLNVGSGLYRVQPVVWRSNDTEWSRAAGLLVQVVPRPGSRGGLYLNPSMQLRTP